MIIINKDQLLEKIEGNGFKIAVIYDQQLRGQDPGYKPFFEKFETESPEALAQKIERFAGTYSGVFSLLLKRAGGGQNSCVVTAQFEGAKNENPNLALNGHGQNFQNKFETQEEIETRLLNKIKNEFKLQALEARNKALEAKLQGMESTGGKLATMLEGWIQAKFFGQKVPSMQGTDTEQKTDQETEIDQDELKKALGKILEVLGGKTVINLSKKLNSDDPNDPIILMVKNYANS